MQEKKYVASPDFILRRIGGEGAVLVPVGDAGELENSVISMNDTYSFILDCFAVPSTIGEVTLKAAQEYEDPQGIMEEQIQGASMELLKRRVIREAE